MRSACQIAVAGLVATQSVRGYQFRVLDSSTMYECGAVALEWTAGGTPPFSVSVFGNYSTVDVEQIPPSAVNSDGSGAYNFTLKYAASVQLMFVMSDQTAWGSGGTSGLYPVAVGPSGISCAQVTATPPWLWGDTPSDGLLPQCSSIVFDWSKEEQGKSNVVYPPVLWQAAVAGGSALQFNSTGTDTNVTFLADIPEGARVLFAAWDAQGRQGGVSELITIQKGSSSCMNSNSPTTSNVPWPSTTAGGGGSTQTGNQTGTVSPNKLSTGAIVGIAVGGAVVMLALVAVLIWLCCRWKDGKRQRDREDNANVDLYDTNNCQEGPLMSYMYPEQGATISPFIGGQPGHLQSNSQQHMWDPATQASSTHLSADPSTDRISQQLSQGSHNMRSTISSSETSHSNNSQSGLLAKARMAAQNPDSSDPDHDFQQPSTAVPSGGFRRHEDAGSLQPPLAEEEAEVEELPPNYNPQWDGTMPR